MQDRRNRVLQFDLMRSIAILIILVYHLPGYSFNFYDLNAIGIDVDFSIFRKFSKFFGLGLFIFISGYLSNLKGRSFTDEPAIKEYAVQKIIKIFPLYYLALILFCYIYDINEPLRVAAHLLGLQLVFSSQFVQPTPTLWFIGLITIYYAAYIFVRDERVSGTIKAMALALFPIVVFAVNRVFDVMDLRIVLYYGVFMLGLYSGRHDIFKRITWTQTAVATLGFAAFLMVYDDYTFAADPFSSPTAFLMINALMFLFINFTYKSCLFLSGRIKLTRSIEILSYSSFCMFLFHRPVWSWMHGALSEMRIVHSEGVMALILALIGIPAIIALSYSLQRLYDKLVPAQ